jgi:hypothetical protein
LRSDGLAVSGALDGYQAVGSRGGRARPRQQAAVLGRRSAQPSRRAVLHVRAAGDPPPAADLVAWYTERAFHFYLAGVRLPGLAPVGARPGARYLAAAFADLDAACAHLRAADGMSSVIVTAHGRGAVATAMWCAARPSAADALVLHALEEPPGVSLSLEIDCPVLVLSPAPSQPAPSQPGLSQPAPPARLARRARSRRAVPVGLRLGGHVTWLQLAAGEDGDRRLLFSELGRWLGAYMYGSRRDQLL